MPFHKPRFLYSLGHALNALIVGGLIFGPKILERCG